MQAAFAGSRLAACVADAPPLPEETRELLHGASLPSFQSLVDALGIPHMRTANPPTSSRLPLRILSSAAAVAVQEKMLWRAYSEGGMHEILSTDLLDALATTVRKALSAVTLHGLSGRSELNGEAAVVLGAVDARTGRVPVRVCATGECVRAKVASVYESDSLPVVLEVGAGSGALSRALAARLVGFARVVATDDGSSRIAAFDEVHKLAAEMAVETYAPTLVLVSWMPSGIDWTLHFRACPSVRGYLLLGESGGSTCGDGWATWGVVPDNGWEYGLDEDSCPPYTADGFERTELRNIAQWQICRFDSADARGFSTTVAFSRMAEPGRAGSDWAAQMAATAAAAGEAVGPPSAMVATTTTSKAHEQHVHEDGDEEEDHEDEWAGESLQESWERMQRSLGVGRAKRLDVEYDMRVVRDDGVR
jgi:hypothetical protein